MSRMKEIIEKYGEEYMLRQLAEECAELAQAALKVIRAKHKETPMRLDEAEEKFMEELADVSVMWRGVYNHMLDEAQADYVDDMCIHKVERMYERMLDGGMEEDVW